MSHTPEALDKVRKLLRLATSANTNEAAAAAAKAQELIDRYQLTAALLTLDAATSISEEPIEDFAAKGAPLDDRPRIGRWTSWLASRIAYYNGAKVYIGDGGMQIIGRASDVDTVRYLYAYLTKEIDRLTEKEGAGCGRTWRNNFRLGAVDTITRKLSAQHAETQRAFRTEEVFKAEEMAEAKQTALMRIERAIAKVEQRRESVIAWQKANLKLYARGGGSAPAYDHGARERGRRAAESISLNAAKRRISGQKGIGTGTGVQS